MATDLVEINPEEPQPEVLEQAAAAVRRGKVVAIPSDALYTLVADPFNLRAVTQAFKAKGRELQRSLPILVRDIVMAEELAGELNNRFFLLARRFWPGPLTIIVPASAKIPLKVTGNTGRMALRQSRSKILNLLIDLLNEPLISTSANISGHPTCRSGIEVFGMMDGRVDLVIDGGACTGQGATTVDITDPYWKVIKAGAIEEKEIAACLQPAQHGHSCLWWFSFPQGHPGKKALVPLKQHLPRRSPIASARRQAPVRADRDGMRASGSRDGPPEISASPAGAQDRPCGRRPHASPDTRIVWLPEGQAAERSGCAFHVSRSIWADPASGPCKWTAPWQVCLPHRPWLRPVNSRR